MQDKDEAAIIATPVLPCYDAAMFIFRNSAQHQRKEPVILHTAPAVNVVWSRRASAFCLFARSFVCLFVFVF